MRCFLVVAVVICLKKGFKVIVINNVNIGRPSFIQFFGDVNRQSFCVSLWWSVMWTTQ